MDLVTVMSELEGYASEQTATIYSRRQPTARLLGVKFGDMAKVDPPQARDGHDPNSTVQSIILTIVGRFGTVQRSASPSTPEGRSPTW